MSSRPHPSELRAGDLIASPWASNIRVLKVTSVEESTLGEAHGDNLNPEKDPDTPAWICWGNPYFGETNLPEPENPSFHFVFTGDGMYERPILLKSMERGLEAEL